MKCFLHKIAPSQNSEKDFVSFILLSTAVDNKMIIKLEYDINHIKYI